MTAARWSYDNKEPEVYRADGRGRAYRARARANGESRLYPNNSQTFSIYNRNKVRIFLLFQYLHDFPSVSLMHHSNVAGLTSLV